MQQKAIPPILEGKNVLVSSPTASGKTEAVCAPLIERNLRRDEKWIILYIVPTRALINDLYNRLFKPCDQIGIKIAKRTGEYRISPQSRIPNIILTTPESFDSMMCRERHDGLHLFYNVVAVVLDEIHLLEGTARGEQVKWLLARLKKILAQGKEKEHSHVEELQIVALSATITNLEEVCKKYLGMGSVITTEGKREIEIIGSPWTNKITETTLIDYLSKEQKEDKILCFCNKRKRVDEISKEMRESLKDLGYETYSHHGSLSKLLREKAEKRMKEAGKCVLFATTTLEIGIDIGDIDLIVLDEPAYDIPGLLQRIGRGNRRTNRTRVMPCADSDLGSLMHDSMISAAKEGWLGPDMIGPQNAVAIQQIMSYIYQSPTHRRSRKTVESLIVECASQRNRDLLLDHLIYTNQLTEKPDGLWLEPEWLDKTEYGKIHVTIEETSGMAVVDRQTGEAIASDISYQSGKYMNIGGKGYEIKNQDRQKLEVTEHKRNMSDATWNYLSRPWFNGPGQSQAVKRYLKIPQDTWPIIQTPNANYIFHFGGAPRRAVLELALVQSEHKKTDYKINNWYIETTFNMDYKPEWITNTTPSIIELAIGDRLPSLEHTLGRPKMNQLLPDTIRTEEIIGWLKIEQELNKIQNSKWEKCTDKQLSENLEIIIQE